MLVEEIQGREREKNVEKTEVMGRLNTRDERKRERSGHIRPRAWGMGHRA